jgi:hypothetical protein
MEQKLYGHFLEAKIRQSPLNLKPEANTSIKTRLAMIVMIPVEHSRSRMEVRRQGSAYFSWPVVRKCIAVLGRKHASQRVEGVERAVFTRN